MTGPSKTGWTGFEISRFMEKHSGKPYARIIPVVIDGDPEEGDCFHSLLLNEIRQQNLRSCTNSRSVRIGEQIFCMPKPKNHRSPTGSRLRRIRYVFQDFLAKAGGKFAVKMCAAANWYSFLKTDSGK